jgi:opacity protein-like surface antigen
MKKFILSMMAVALLAAVPASAKVKFGAKGGINITHLSFSTEMFNTSNRVGWFIGPALKVGLPLGFGVDGAVLFDSRKTEVENGNNLTFNSLQIPVNARYDFNPVKALGIYVATGPQFGINLGDTNVKLNDLGNTLDMNRAAISWNIGAGVILFKHLEVGAAYNFPISKLGDIMTLGNSDDTRTKVWTVSAAYYF